MRGAWILPALAAWLIGCGALPGRSGDPAPEPTGAKEEAPPAAVQSAAGGEHEPPGAAPQAPPAVAGARRLGPPPLPVQQARAYPETATGDFLALADFEPRGPDRPGSLQVRQFHISGRGSGGTLRHVLGRTRTGTGALEVLLPAGRSLAFRIPDLHDLSSYTLLSLALHSPTVRDDLRLTLRSQVGPWTSPRTLVQPGWNNVLIDIRRLDGRADFDTKKVRTLELRFADAAGPLRFHVDDILLINNRRRLGPTPPGMALEKIGLDYRLTLGGAGGPLELAQGDDGLWRWSRGQGRLEVLPADGAPRAEDPLAALGARRIGQAKLAETNRLRVRLVHTWYFPDRAGAWASLSVRRVRWETTFYADGRRVTHVTLNNAGGAAIGAVRLHAGRTAVWPDGRRAAERRQADFEGPVGRWSYLLPPDSMHADLLADSYAKPGRIVPLLAEETAAAGDDDGDGFDESQGCYVVRPRGRHCRFRLEPPEAGVLRPVFLVPGPWAQPPAVQAAGQAVRRVILRADGAALFALEAWLRQATVIEVRGPRRHRPGGVAANQESLTE